MADIYKNQIVDMFSSQVPWYLDELRLISHVTGFYFFAFCFKNKSEVKSDTKHYTAPIAQ